MKKLLVLCSIMLMTMLTGCVDVDLTVDIEKNGNAKMIVKILGESYLMSEVNEEDLTSEYDDVQRISEGTKTGYMITSNLNEGFDLDGIESNEYATVTKEGGLLSNTYVVDAKLRDAMFSEMTSEDMSMISVIGNSVPFKLHVKSPIEFEESNATSVEEVDGKNVYNWDYTLATLNNIYIKVKVPNVVGIASMVIATLSLVGIVVFIILKKKNKNQDITEEDSQDSNDLDDNQ